MKNIEISKEAEYDIYSPGDTTLCAPCHVTFLINQMTHYIEKSYWGLKNSVTDCTMLKIENYTPPYTQNRFSWQNMRHCYVRIAKTTPVHYEQNLLLLTYTLEENEEN